MKFNISLDPVEKLIQMGDAAAFEPAGDAPHREMAPPSCFTPQGSSRRVERNRAALERSISRVSTPSGPKPILKTMVTTACERNCYYCPFRAGRSSTERITFQPDELVSGYLRLEKAGFVDGIFLSSGILNGGSSSQDKIIDTAEILRKRSGYQGYVHLKIMPGAEYEQVRRTMQLADRVSINLEGATPEGLGRLAPKKDFWDELVQRLLWVEEIRRNERVRATSVTQFVVGAVGETDLELLSLSEKLYRQAGIRRAYYSGFQPLAETPFSDLRPVVDGRTFRLYQAGFLLRDYGWELEEIPFGDDQNLPLDRDPKEAWAARHLSEDPVEVNRADRRSLLRVPGIGPKTADAILQARRTGTIRSLIDLRALGLRSAAKSAPYLLLDGKRAAHQLSIFSS